MCPHSFWYKSQLHEHLKSSHSISDPERYEREEREKKLRRIREEQQRHIMSKRRMRGSASASASGSRRGMPIGRPGRPIAGPRPSFQYRDGAFICDLCKKSFSDGNDMVSHWKSHVKKQRMEGGYRGRGRPAAYPPGKRGPGRPPKDGYGRVIHKDYTSSSGRPITGRSAGRGRGRGRGRGGRADKGKPRWTAYLVWSTRRRKQIAEEGEGLTFAEVAKQISVEWKEVGEDEKDKLQDEAEEMNACGQRKLDTTAGSSESESSTSDSDIDTDPEFDDDGVEKKPIMLKIKREDGTEEEVPAPKKPRSSRERKRPSFFQEFENEESNLDKILDDFEQEQIEESKQPKPAKKPNPTGAGRPRGKRRKRTPSPEEPEEPVELEKSRSGRVRKKPKFQAYFKGDGDEDDIQEIDDESEDDGEFKPDEDDEAEEEIEDDLEEDVEEEEVEEIVDGVKVMKKVALPPKKRSELSKKILTDGEIEEATKAALTDKDGEAKEDGTAASSESPEGATKVRRFVSSYFQVNLL